MSRRPSASRLEPDELVQRQEFVRRNEELQEAMSECQRAVSQLEGAWTFWREKVIAPKYGLRPEDEITDEGKIVRAPRRSSGRAG